MTSQSREICLREYWKKNRRSSQMGQTLSKVLLKSVRVDVQDAPSPQHEKALRYCARIATSIWKSTAETKVLVRYGNTSEFDNNSKLAESIPKYSLLIDGEVYTAASAKAIEGLKNPTILKSEDSLFDLIVTINPKQPWYTGYDGRVPEDEYDLITVCLHEIIHGLFLFSDKLEAHPLYGTAKFTGAVAETGNERFHAFVAVETTSGDCSILSYRDTPQELYRAVTSDKLYFRTAERRMARLHAPKFWKSSHSLNHIDYRDMMNLMKPILRKGEAYHHIEENVLDIMNTVRDKSATRAKICGRGSKYAPPSNIFTYWPFVPIIIIVLLILVRYNSLKKKHLSHGKNEYSIEKLSETSMKPRAIGKRAKPPLRPPLPRPGTRSLKKSQSLPKKPKISS